MTALVIAEHDSTTIKSATLNAVTTVKARNSTETHIPVAGSNATAAAQAATQIVGVAKMTHAGGAGLADGLAENLAAQVLAVATNYSRILLPATTSDKNVVPHVMTKLGVTQINNIIKVESFDIFERPTYAGNTIALVRSNDAVKVVAVQTTAFEATTATRGFGAVEATEYVTDNGQSRLMGHEVTVSDRPKLASARIIVSGGRASGSAERFSEVVTPLADKLDAVVGTSRAAVDAGYAPNDLQVGQTGKIVAPQLYIALGISGAIQHLTGMKDSKIIVVTNKDPEASIFSIVDYELAVDLLTIVPELMKAL